MSLMVPTLICLGIGVLLLIVEIFTPGLGAAGAFGALALLAAVLLQIGNPVGILFMVALVLLLAALALILFLRLGIKGKFDRTNVVLSESIQAEGFKKTERQELVGKTGVAQTVLRPSGKAMIDGQLSDVVTKGEFILAGRAVQVTAVEGMNIVVQALEPGEQEENAVL